MSKNNRYIEIAEIIKKRVAEGQYKQGQRLPSEVELAEELQVSRGSIREALLLLEDESIIVRKHGIGSFVSSRVNKVVAGIENLTPWTEAISNAGYEVEDKILSVDWVSIDDSEAEQLEVAAGSPGLRIESIRLADGEPVIFASDLLPSTVVPNAELLNIRKKNNSIITFLDEIQRNPKNFISTIQAVKAGPKLSEILEVETDTPLILMEGVLYDYSALPLAFSKYYFRSDKYQFTLVRSRKIAAKSLSKKTNVTLT